MDEDNEEKVKPKWSFPPKKVASSSTKKKKVEYTNCVSKYPPTILNTIWQ